MRPLTLDCMKNNLKRNALCCWFATNVYFVKGSGVRKELPDCIACLIRMKHPNKKGNHI